MSNVRIINDKTGDVKYVSANIASQAKLLKSYGYRIEDLNILEESKKKEAPNPETVTPPVIDEDDNLFEMEEEHSSYSDEGTKEDTTPASNEKKRPGPKPKK